VGIRNGYIVEIGDLSQRQGKVDLDVRGLFVAPGFINIHSHAVPAALPTARNMLILGVTTEIMNPDGAGGIDIAEQLTRSGSVGLAVNHSEASDAKSAAGGLMKSAAGLSPPHFICGQDIFGLTRRRTQLHSTTSGVQPLLTAARPGSTKVVDRMEEL
jgi:N-acyl-D-aspartate/D-glutamate deacylase